MNSPSWRVTVGGGRCPVCGLDGKVASVPGWWAQLSGWLVNGQTRPSTLVCDNGHEWPAGSASVLRLTAAGGGWWRWPWEAVRVVVRHRTAEPVPLFWLVAALVGAALGVAAQLALGLRWWPVAVGWLVLVWLLFLATALRYPGREDLWIDLLAAVSPQRARRLEMRRLLRLTETAPARVYGLAEWEGPRRIGGHGRSSSEGLTHLELIYGSPLDEPYVRVNTIWRRQQPPDIPIEGVRSRLTRELWHRQLRPPDELSPGERHDWIRVQSIEIDQRPIPDWTPTHIPIDGVPYNAQVYREGDDWAAVIETEPVLIEIQGYQVSANRLDLASIADLTPYADDSL